jgi:hypothetical protein
VQEAQLVKPEASTHTSQASVSGALPARVASSV